MQRTLGWMSTMAAVAMLCGSARAQMVVHAVSGTVKAISPSSKSMDVTVESGDTSRFKLPSDAKVTLDFDKALQSDATDPAKFAKVGDYAVVYYYGYGEDETAVGVKDLGAGPFQKVEGTIVNYDKHTRVITVKDDAGKTNTFALGDHLVVDQGVSVESGRSYDPHKGWHVRVTYTQAGDKRSAVFIRSRQ